MYRLEDEEEEEDQSSKPRLNDKIDEVLLKSRRIFLCDAVDTNSTKDTIRKLWYLDIIDPGKPILLVINSPGGSVDAGFAIWDQVKMLSSPVTTLVTGLAASFGSVLSLCAAPKRRFATPHARIMIHQPRVMGIIQGQATDLSIHAEQIAKTRKQLVDTYVQATGKSAQEIDLAIDRDRWFSVDEALDYGLLDGIVKTFKELG